MKQNLFIVRIGSLECHHTRYKNKNVTFIQRKHYKSKKLINIDYRVVEETVAGYNILFDFKWTKKN
jgi:mannose-1-phosphate guanylyltransferase